MAANAVQHPAGSCHIRSGPSCEHHQTNHIHSYAQQPQRSITQFRDPTCSPAPSPREILTVTVARTPFSFLWKPHGLPTRISYRTVSYAENSSCIRENGPQGWGIFPTLPNPCFVQIWIGLIDFDRQAYNHSHSTTKQ